MDNKFLKNCFDEAVNGLKRMYRLNFGVYYTPAENLCNTSYKKFVKKYGLIENVTAYKPKEDIILNMIELYKKEKGSEADKNTIKKIVDTEKFPDDYYKNLYDKAREMTKLKPRGYFTNSIHVPVFKEISPFEKINIESELTGYSSSGCISYVEIGDNAQNNLKALEQIIDYAMEKDIPYFALNTSLSDCTKCGYSGYIEDGKPCPVCGADHDKYINDYARITGYLSTKVSHFNDGKKAEKKDRFTHVNKLSNWQK